MSGPVAIPTPPAGWRGREVRPADFAVAFICLLGALHAIFVTPINADASFILRQAKAQAEGFVPCRDIYCEYTPLVTTILAGVAGAIVPSILLVQIALLMSALLTYRLARTLGNEEATAVRMAVVTWAVLLASEGRSLVTEPFALICLLGAANSFAASGAAPSGSFRAGIWIAAGFWAKQYALLGWVGLVAAALWSRRFASAAALTAGTLGGVSFGFLLLLALGAEPSAFSSLFEVSAYPRSPMISNLLGAPDLLGALILTFLTLRLPDLRPADRRALRVPFLMALAALLPFVFRGYRHYWQFVLPFLVVLLLRPLPRPAPVWIRGPRHVAVMLLALGVGLDLSRCMGDLLLQTRESQRLAAVQLRAHTKGSAAPLYLADPALLTWLQAPILALRQVGPKFTRFSRSESDALLAEAQIVVWDTSVPGADELLNQLEADPWSELALRGFVRTRVDGPIQVFSRPSMSSLADSWQDVGGTGGGS